MSRDPLHGKYRLGYKLFELGSRAIAHVDLRTHALPFLHQLAEDTEETAHISVLDQGEMLSIINVEGPWSLRLRSGVGRRTPVHCTSSGKAMAASLSERALTSLLQTQTFHRFTPRTIVTKAQFKLALKGVRDAGYAVDDEELEEGLRCIGTAIRDHTGQAVGTISISGPVFRVTTERVPTIAARVVDVGRRLSANLGYGTDRESHRRPRKR